MSMSWFTTQNSRFIEIDAGDLINAVTFTTNGEYLVIGGPKSVRVLRVQDGKEMAAMGVDYPVQSVAVSKDGRWIAARSSRQVLIWDATTYKPVFVHDMGLLVGFDVDFSPDSTRLVSADGFSFTATIWDVAAHRKVRTLEHKRQVLVAKYSPQGDRIATTSVLSVGVWDSNDGDILVDINLMYVGALLWFKNHLFVIANAKEIEEIHASTGSTVSKWPVPLQYHHLSSIALPQHGEFIAYSTLDNITFWDTSAHTQLDLIPTNRAYVIALSPDDQFLAFAAANSKITIGNLPLIKGIGERPRNEQTKHAIRTAIKNAIRDSPLVLIDADSGRLCNKSEQAAAFESMPVFVDLISATTTHIDHAHIEREVKKFYRYAMFSHTWEDNEPLFDKVTKILVYDLEASPTHDKLKMFCKIARDLGFKWAWSDTCCIDKGSHLVLQEALVSMFKWYEGSAMTIIFLRGVHRLAQRGAMMRSIWNTRGWTLQEYRAAKVVRFYTQDWTLYLGLDIYNHKDSPEIISEMEEVMGISAKTLMALRPGLDDICEKLYLASTRQTTRIEDAAYSLLGIFSVSLPVVYGEGEKALGRLLAELLTSSGDTSILAWTGMSGSFNSCLPASISVFSRPPTSHIPPVMTNDELQKITTRLCSLDLTSVTTLYDRLNDLPLLSFSGRRLKLPCLTFKLGPVSASRNGSERVFRAQTTALGIVEIRTEEDLSRLGSLYLIHPWIDFLLDRHSVEGATETTIEENIDDKSSVLGGSSSFPGSSNISSTTRPFGGQLDLQAASLLPPSTSPLAKKQLRVLQFIARLRQSFGALLLTPTRRNVEEYRRVAAESLITVQIEELTSAILDKLIQGVRMLDVL